MSKCRAKRVCASRAISLHKFMCLPRRTSPYLSVAHADELAGLPPTFIGVGTLDLFVAESIAYAQQLIRCRVASELRIYPGVMHGFDWLKEARAALQFVSDHLAALRRLLA
ncbi:alpha/beta hydrolase [Pseudomonas sp. SJZ079]|uniref:alpha/beta hydrolase n=1 Tax=Pseudomonas sp. SJZ079 TaxID=2572887 RepID=UPI001C498D21|nr:alpha/beta hydrolase fold domain-containing protein [Pseudomonas sp. SJZ079]